MSGHRPAPAAIEGQRRRCEKSTRFSRSAVDRHIQAKHARIPPDVADILAERIASREWREPLTLGHAFALAAQAYVRHRMTDYDRLLRIPALTREEALLIVGGEVAAVLKAWATPAAD